MISLGTAVVRSVFISHQTSLGLKPVRLCGYMEYIPSEKFQQRLEQGG